MRVRKEKRISSVYADADELAVKGSWQEFGSGEECSWQARPSCHSKSETTKAGARLDRIEEMRRLMNEGNEAVQVQVSQHSNQESWRMEMQMDLPKRPSACEGEAGE